MVMSCLWYYNSLAIIPVSTNEIDSMLYLNRVQLSTWSNDIYLIFSINLVLQVTLRSSGTDILYSCHLLRCLYNILYFMWLHSEFFIILYNILKIAELDCCQIIILSVYEPSTHAYTHVLCLSLELPNETR
jgi:hypothetical protein